LGRRESISFLLQMEVQLLGEKRLLQKGKNLPRGQERSPALYWHERVTKEEREILKTTDLGGEGEEYILLHQSEVL